MGAASRAEDWYGRAKLATGLILFAFVATHLLNHAMGLMSLRMLDLGAVAFKGLWRSWPGTILLYGAVLTHPLLALFNWLRRGHYRGIPWQGWVQLGLGLLIPVLVVEHVMGTRGLNAAFGVNDTYVYVLASIFVAKPEVGLTQNLLILVAWGHACIGMYYWLRLKAFYERWWPIFFAAALLLPTLAILGYVSSGRAVRMFLADEAFRENFRAGLNWPGDAAPRFVTEGTETAQLVLAALLVAGLVGRGLYALAQRRHGLVTLRYPDGRRYRGRAGHLSVLEASRAIGFPHASICGGQGRCSTCRVRVLGEGAALLPPPDVAEAKVLARIRAGEGVRLACQIKPTADLAVLPLLPAGVTPKVIYGAESFAQGSERRIAILFADLRGFTKFSEGRLPYDVVFVLNQYFRAMGQAVEGANGRLDKFIGDGVMALFGIDEDPDAACRHALQAAAAMGAALARLNEELTLGLGQTLRMGIGIHCGPAIVGEMGHGRTLSLTAVGDAVNTASRLETATKDFSAELVISDEVAQRAGIDESAGWRRESVELRGKSEPLTVLVRDTLAGISPPSSAATRQP